MNMQYANLQGNRDNIDSMAGGSQKVLVQVLKLIDAHDLYGSVAYPKHHGQSDISDIYLFARETRGVFVNIALQEPFGLTVIEAAAHGVPTVATQNGGPVDIMATLHHGVVVDPTDSNAIAAALLSILTVPTTWDSMSLNGVNNIMAYSWPAHCKRYMESLDAERRVAKSRQRQDRTMSGLLEKRLSRLDLMSFGEDVPPASPDHAGMDMLRQYSVPAHMHPTAASQGSPRPVRKQLSGLTLDDIGVLQTVQSETAARRSTTAAEVGLHKKHFVAIPLDSDACVGQVARVLTALHSSLVSAGLDSSVGIGVLSMLGFDSTFDHLQSLDVDMDAAIDFMVCNSGADMWLRCEDGRWDADEAYEDLIEFQWDRISLHRMLKKIISAPAENSRHLPRLKELLYNVAEKPESGVHPRHICLELDPETQGILVAGMGPRAKSADGVLLSALVTERLKRRLRSKGFRANYTLQIVPRGSGENVSVLHITPLRASRPLALRSLAVRMGLEMDSFSCLVLPVEVKGDTVGDAALEPWTGDTADLIAGMQSVYVQVPDDSGKKPLKGLLEYLGIPLEPWKECPDRVALVGPGIGAGVETIVADLKKKMDATV